MFDEMRKNYKSETNIVMMLSLCPSGLTYEQIKLITEFRSIGMYGNWRAFLRTIAMNTDIDKNKYGKDDKLSLGE
jgi:hypothetical protein